jgi:RimJ/RimL family protein N-acetyltransferase
MAAMAVMSAREATEADATLLLRWRNDPTTQAWSRNPTSIPAAEHLAWLRAVLRSKDRLLLVVENEEGPAGMVRFDQVSSVRWEVSITVAPERRGGRLASTILAAAEAELRRRTPTVDMLVASMHQDNQRSRALFRRAGYVEWSTAQADGPFVWVAKYPATAG